MSRNLTAADAVITLQVDGLFTTPQQLQGFSAQNIFTIGSTDLAETQIGVDGKLSAGFIFATVTQAFELMADSLSNDLFDTWYAQTRTSRDVFRCQGRTTLPSLGQTWIMVNGVLKSGTLIPPAARTLQSRTFPIEWESVQRQPN